MKQTWSGVEPWDERTESLEGILTQCDSQEELAAIFDYVGDGIVLLDMTCKIIRVNRRILEVGGYSEKEIIGKRFDQLKILPPESIATMRDAFVKAASGQEVPLHEIEVYSKGGEKLTLELLSSSLKKKGKVSGVVTVLRDITERKRAEEKLHQVEYALRQSEQNFRNSLDSSPLGVRIVTIDGTLLYANQAILDIYGYSSVEELRTTPVKERYTLESYAEFEERRERRKRGEPIPFNYELSVVRKDGQVRYLSVFLSEVIWGGKTELIALYQDITERKQAGEALQKSEVSLRTYLESAPDGVYLSDLGGRFIYGNKKAEEIIGYEKEELIGKSFLKLNLLPTKYLAKAGKLLALNVMGKPTGPDEFELIKKDGGRVWVEINTTPITQDGKVVVIGFVRDITERKRAEEKLHQVEYALRQSEQNFHNSLDSSPLGVCIISTEEELLYANQAMLDIYGYSSVEELITTPVKERYTPESYAEHGGRIGKIKRGENISSNYELNIVRKDGQVRHLLVFLNEVIWGGKTEFMALYQDITEQKRAEEALRQSEQNFRNSLDSSPLGVGIVTADGEPLYANQAILDIYGYSSIEELKAIPVKEHYTPQSYTEHRERIERRKSGKPVPTNYEISIVRKDGQVRHLSVFRKKVIWGDKTQTLALYQDITEKKRAEEALRESEEKYRRLFERSPIGIITVDMNGVITSCNPAVYKTGGYSEGELVGKHFSEIAPIQLGNIPRYIRMFNSVIEGKVPRPFEVAYRRKDGTRAWTEVHIALLKAGGNKIGVQVLQRDITGHKQAEEALQQSEQNFRNSLDSSPLGVRIVTADGETLYANKAVLDIYGYSSIEELRTTPVKNRYTPQSYSEFKERREKRKRGEPVPSNYEISIVRKDGEIRHLSVFRKELVWGGETQFMALYQDITEQKRVEFALRRSEEVSSSLFINSPNPILVLGEDATITYVNPALEKLTGFTRAELIGKTPPYPWWIGGTREACQRNLMKALRRGKRKYEQLFKRKDGQHFWVEITLKTVVLDEEFKYHLENWVDLTEQKRLKENMQFYISEITKTQEEERKRIAREIHDEWVQSLAALALHIDAMLTDTGELPENIIERIRGLRARTNSVLEGLRRFSHELRPGVIDQVGLVPALEVLTEELNKETEVSTRLEVTGSERRLTAEIELGLFRIAQEALRNVRRHSKATEVEIKLKFTQRRVKLTIDDNGTGFELPEMLGDLATEGKLGLIGMQERARLLDGKLSVKSRVGRGTRIALEVEV